MTMGPYKYRGCSPKRTEELKSGIHAVGAKVIGKAVNSQTLFGRNGARLAAGGKRLARGDFFPALLSDANRELAALLQDVCAVKAGEEGRTQDVRTRELLVRAVQCAAKQYILQTELGNLAFTDELTGLYNRRGFMAIGERQLKIGRRSGRGMLLFFIDVDGMKLINDSYGHCEGDLSLRRTAKALKMAFRDSDIIARLGGDEFAVLAIEASGNGEAAIRTRLCRALATCSAEERRYQLSLSLGAARFDSRGNVSFGELLARADRAMYEQKRRQPKSVLDAFALLPGGEKSVSGEDRRP